MTKRIPRAGIASHASRRRSEELLKQQEAPTSSSSVGPRIWLVMGICFIYDNFSFIAPGKRKLKRVPETLRKLLIRLIWFFLVRVIIIFLILFFTSSNFKSDSKAYNWDVKFQYNLSFEESKDFFCFTEPTVFNRTSLWGNPFPSPSAYVSAHCVIFLWAVQRNPTLGTRGRVQKCVSTIKSSVQNGYREGGEAGTPGFLSLDSVQWNTRYMEWETE